MRKESRAYEASKRIVVVGFIGATLLLSFQNCAPGFKVDGSGEGTFGSTSTGGGNGSGQSGGSSGVGTGPSGGSAGNGAPVHRRILRCLRDRLSHKRSFLRTPWL
ncbi:MAG: hypothetical protein EOP50_20710 [Sphingobacteriales bacterium]|nr:MAG: hypothetical protein EOP50_20710 [Sphingobacteriales bacterium]